MIKGDVSGKGRQLPKIQVMTLSVRDEIPGKFDDFRLTLRVFAPYTPPKPERA